MPDFYQHPRLPTLHHLADVDLTSRGTELAQWTQVRPMCLLLPALAAEFEKEALPQMLKQIAEVPYVNEVLLSVNGMTAQQLDQAKSLVQKCLKGKPCRILWNDGPDLLQLRQKLEAHGVPAYKHGKGTNIWMGVAHLLARGEHSIVACHDTDILSYERGMLWRLVYPVANPDMGYRFAKGYYGRVGDKLYGRITRLLVAPLLQSFSEIIGSSDLLEHYAAFRYPLSGEFCSDLTTLGKMSMPTGWGLEVALLGEVHGHVARKYMCQVDLGFNFEHHHRDISNAPASTGLSNTASDVIATLADYLLKDLSKPQQRKKLREVAKRYAKLASAWVPRYEHDALFNGLNYDRRDELRAVEVFAQTLTELPDKMVTTLHQPPAGKIVKLAGVGKALAQAAMEV